MSLWPPAPFNEMPSSGLRANSRLIIASDPEFHVLIDRHYPRFTASHEFVKLRHITALLHNHGQVKMRGYAIVWTFIAPASGENKQVYRDYVGSHCVQRTHDKALQADDVRLLSPFFNLSPAEYRPDVPDQLGLFMLNDSLSADHSVSATIDCAIYEDRTFIGPDATQFRKKFVAMRNAEHDEARSVQLMLSNMGRSPDRHVIDSFLETHVRKGLAQLGDEPKSHYWRTRGSEAGRLRHRLLTNGSVHFVHYLERRLRYRREYLFQQESKSDKSN